MDVARWGWRHRGSGDAARRVSAPGMVPLRYLPKFGQWRAYITSKSCGWGLYARPSLERCGICGGECPCSDPRQCYILDIDVRSTR